MIGIFCLLIRFSFTIKTNTLIVIVEVSELVC